MLAAELAERQQGAITIGSNKEEDPFVLSPEMIVGLDLLKFAGAVLSLAARSQPGPKRLAAGPGGRPMLYRAESIWVTLLVMAVWQLSPEAMVKRLRRWPPLAVPCGYAPGAVISASQLRRRRDELGLWAYFVTFCALVWVLIRRGVLIGRDWVLDSTIFDAFSRKDSEAGWSFTRRFGYKVHLLLCRDSLLPIMLLVSPANAHDAPWALPLMALARLIFALPVQVVRADAAYFTRPILTFITTILHAAPKVVFNPRKAGKKQLVTWAWVAQFRADKGKRGYIERFFALLKRYFRLGQHQGRGLSLAYRHAFEVCIASLLVAWLADHLGRRDLMHARSRLLAPC